MDCRGDGRAVAGDGLEEGEVHCQFSEERFDVALLGGPHVFDPVMAGFGDDGDDVFYLFFQAIGGAGGEFEDSILAAGRDVFHIDGADQPVGHGGAFADDADPAEGRGFIGG